MTEEQKDELTNLSHLILDRLATLEQINRFNFLRKQVEARNSLSRFGETNPLQRVLFHFKRLNSRPESVSILP